MPPAPTAADGAVAPPAAAPGGAGKGLIGRALRPTREVHADLVAAGILERSARHHCGTEMTQIIVSHDNSRLPKFSCHVCRKESFNVLHGSAWARRGMSSRVGTLQHLDALIYLYSGNRTSDAGIVNAVIGKGEHPKVFRRPLLAMLVQDSKDIQEALAGSFDGVIEFDVTSAGVVLAEAPLGDDGKKKPGTWIRHQQVLIGAPRNDSLVEAKVRDCT
eukprot:gene8442-6494_t